MNTICLVVGLLIAPLDDTVILRWTHSIEKIVWEEEYRCAGGLLHLEEARVRGSGAGMEPPPGAVLQDGAWRYRPELPPLPHILLRHSPHVPPYILCSAGECKAVSEWLPGLPEHAVIELTPCDSLPDAGLVAVPSTRK
ncbi:MAG: hypothetical protein BWK76_26035 [Desulfobulbaceae bacterium A2]|nr:MAG: hypothetical protein BWK76_26035 [Desulfobulbaceae bacterium A2]